MLSLAELRQLHDRLPEVPAAPPQDGAAAADCLFMHRTVVLMADGEVVTCANMYAETVGRFDGSMTLASIWNNARMQALRSSLGTEHEWRQCRHCWFREIRYAEQRGRFAADQDGGATLESLTRPAQYQPIAWDFRGHREKAKP